MKLSKIQIAFIGIVLLILLSVVLLFTGVIPGLRSTTQDKSVRGAITVWGVFDDDKEIGETLITDFRAAYPGVSVQYLQLDERSYEQDLVNALAAGEGPDVFMIHNTWLSKHKPKIRPLTTITSQTFASLFPQVATNDFVADSLVYASPLYIDSLALFYNQTMLDAAGIAQPPKTWNDLITIIPRLRRVDERGRIEQAAVAIGGSEDNINQATDLLSILMFQEGASMINNAGTSADFSQSGGTKALDFYTSFANPRNPQYTWNPDYFYSLDGFVQEKIAMIFNYGYQAEVLRERNPFLNFVVTPMLQQNLEDQAINYADYWGFAVAKSSPQPAVAELFTTFTTMNEGPIGNYLLRTDRSPALRSVISRSTNSENIGVFATQALTAQSWPQPDMAAVENIFSEAIDLVVGGKLPTNRAIRQAEEEITQLLQKNANRE